MANVTLNAHPRTETGNGPTRRLRKRGLVPGILYQPPGPSIGFAVAERELRRALISEHGRERVVEITIGDEPARPAMLVDWQLDPVRGDIWHVDFRPADPAEIADAEAEAPAAVSPPAEDAAPAGDEAPAEA